MYQLSLAVAVAAVAPVAAVAAVAAGCYLSPALLFDYFLAQGRQQRRRGAVWLRRQRSGRAYLVI